MKNLLKKSLCCVFAVIQLCFFTHISFCAYAAQHRDELDETFLNDVKPTLKSSPVSKFHINEFVIELEKTDLSDIQKYLSAGEIRHTGDAASSTYSLCYIFDSKGRAERILFLSGEMGGDEHSLLTLEISAAQNEQGCVQLPKKFRPSLDNGLWLGSSVESLTRRVGKPSRKIQNWQIYYYEGSAIGSNDSSYTTLATFMAKIDHGKVIAVEESQITAN